MTISFPYLFIEAQSYYTIAQLALSLQCFYFGLLSAGTLGCTTVPSLLPTVFLSALLTLLHKEALSKSAQLINPQIGSHNDFLCQF